MTQNIKSKERGFTIVELLVVIVIIGILAAITIVSYTGVTAKANTAANKSNAASVLSAAMAVYAEENEFPATNATSASVIENLNAGVTKVPATLSVTNAQLVAGSTIQYLLDNADPALATGICVGYWNYTSDDGGPGAAWIYGGEATTATNVTTPTCD